jgi:hypothetical protein
MSLLQKQSHPIPEDDQHLEAKQSRDLMKDDAGASTGLRRRPDYGEPGSYTEDMNEKNKKGTVAGYFVAVEPNSVKLASDGPMYVTAVDFDPRDATTVKKFSFSADVAEAMTFHKLTASEVAAQIGGPGFGVRAHVLTAANYGDMFKAVERVVPKVETTVTHEIQWAKSVLKRNDRIIWYLRWYRLALVKNLLKTQVLYDELNTPDNQALIDDLDRQSPGNAVQASKVADDAASLLEPPQQQQQAPQAPPEPQAPQTIAQQLEGLVAQYKKEFAAKSGGNESTSLAAERIDIDDFPEMKSGLDHYLSFDNVVDIQNKVLTFESYQDVKDAYSVAEQAHQQKAEKILRPQAEDQVWMKFPNGWAWWWLPRASCSEESKAMGHCGNSPEAGRKGTSILSLREPKKYGKETLWEPHLTFILRSSEDGAADAGSLGQMKGRNNDKPVAKYHPYIMSLLKDPRISSVVGGGHLPQNNFALADLTPEQRKEVAQANPSIGMTMQDYYAEHGMDRKLLLRVQTALGLGSGAKYSASLGFVVRQWKNEDEFIEECGDRDAKAAQMFLETGETDHSEPDEDDLTELMEGLDAKQIYHVGLGLQYHYAAEISEWYDQPPDIHDPEAVKALFADVFRMKVQPAIKKQRDNEKANPATDEDEADETQQDDPETIKARGKSPYMMPVVQDFYESYRYGDPDEETVGEELQQAIQQALDSSAENGTTIEYEAGGIFQTVEADRAVELAAEAEAEQGRYRNQSRDFAAPSIYMPSSWDDFSDERAKEALGQAFDEPPKRPAAKKQRNLPYRGKGVRVSKLRNQLFAAAGAAEGEVAKLMEKRSFSQGQTGDGWAIYFRNTDYPGDGIWLKVFFADGKVSKTDMFDEEPQNVIETRLGFDGLVGFTQTLGD